MRGELWGQLSFFFCKCLPNLGLTKRQRFFSESRHISGLKSINLPATGAEMQNSTANVSYVEFTLVPFPGLQELRPFLAIPFFCLFLLIVTTIVIYTVKTEESLHSPMCLLIALLLTVNLFGTFAILPRMLFSLLLPASHISPTECLVQMFFLYFTIFLDCNVLLIMALDRFLAICHPLRYAELMTIKLLSHLTLLSLLRVFAWLDRWWPWPPGCASAV